MQLTFLGTGGARQVPVFGCDCLICQRARREPAFRRRACSAMLNYQGKRPYWMRDCRLWSGDFRRGKFNVFTDTLPHGSRSGVISFALGCGNSIPVYGPPDEQGCDDLFKHPGILAFQPPLTPFATVELGGMRITRCRCNTPN